MKVLIVNDHGSVNGGSAQVAIASACALKHLGVDVLYFCAVGPVDLRLAEAGIEAICLGQHDLTDNPSKIKAAVSGLWNPISARALEATLSRLDASQTVVHIHGWTKALTSSIFSVCKAKGFRVVHTLHEYFTACPNGGFFDYQRVAICTRPALGVDCLTTNCDSRGYPEKAWRVVRQFITRGVAKVPAQLEDVIFLSKVAKDVLKPYYPPSTRWHAVRNPIAMEKPEERARPWESRTFLYVGRLDPEKGADLFIEACQAAGVDSMIVGDGVQRAELMKVAASTVFTGWIESHKVRSILAGSRALVLPSRWYEGQPLVVQEALALGIPVIVSDRTGSTELVQDSENGFLFKCGSAQDLKEKIKRLLDDELVRSMSAKAYEGYWSAPPTAESHARELKLLYREILER